MGNRSKGIGIFKRRELTKNEKTLLTLLTLLIVLWLVYRFIYIPQTEKLALLREQKIEYEEKIFDINRILRKEKEIVDDWNNLHLEKDKIISRYFPKLDQAQIIYLLNSLVEDENLFVKDLNFSRPSYEGIGDFEVRNMAIFLPYTGSYSGIIDVINRLKDSPRKILVDNISMDLDSNGSLNGNMALKIYSLEGIAEADERVIYIDTAQATKDSPFAPVALMDLEDEEDLEAPEIKPYIEETLFDFEARNFYFIPSHPLIKGNLSLSNNAKSNKYSLRLEYNMLAVEDENIGYIDISKGNINLKYPPNTIGIWVYAYNYSPASLGAYFRGQMGEELWLPFTEGIGWTGWKYLELSPPHDMGQYPLKLEKLYIQLPEDRDDYGILLMDKLEAVYSRNMDDDGQDASLVSDYIFHLVEPGDTLTQISKEYYGDIRARAEIMKLNDLGNDDILPVGKVLLLKKP